MARNRNKKRSAQSKTSTSATSPTGPGHNVRRVYLILTAFCAGASVMVVELAGNRVLAPWFGNSLHTWTGLIGVILISISAGYYLGGYLADRWPSYVVLAHLLTVSAVLTMLIPSFQSSLAGSIERLDVVWGPVLATAGLFALPGCLLAAVSPFAIRLISLLSNDKRVGVSAGSVGMSATLGSVSGTFATGFYLVPHLRLRTIFVSTGLMLALLAMAGYLLFSIRFRRNRSLACVPLALFGLLGGAAYFEDEERSFTIVHEEHTFYHRIQVIEKQLPDRGDRLWTLCLDSTIEGRQYENSREVPDAHQRYWELARLFCPHATKAAFLGGGAYAVPEAFLDAFPQATADVVEIDPAVIDVGRKYFRVDDYPRMNAIAGDARRFLRSTDTRYDWIYGDAYRGVACIPAHLTTLEFFELAKSRLNDRGVLAVNISGSLEGGESKTFRSVARTLGQVFAHQCVFATKPSQPDRAQNIFVVAAEHDLAPESLVADRFVNPERIEAILSSYVPPERYDLSDGILLTDDYNPIEYFAAQGVKLSPSRR